MVLILALILAATSTIMAFVAAHAGEFGIAWENLGTALFALFGAAMWIPRKKGK